tara:strand:+ start:5021 stop:5914 length:894 start_codon:yes stop_codon:yes gene_type:complete
MSANVDLVPPPDGNAADAPVAPVAPVAPAPPVPGVYVRFHATQSSPDFTRIYMETGGRIDAAAIPWQTDFSTSGGSRAVFCHLQRERVERVFVPVELSELKDAGVDADGVHVVEVHPDFRVNVSTSRLCPAINGTLVASVSGQGSVSLRALLDNEHAQVGLEYKSWLAHGATVCMSGARVVRVLPGGESVPLQLCYRKDAESDAYEAFRDTTTVKLLNEYVRSSSALRESVVYEPSPNLTKSVFKTTVGMARQGTNCCLEPPHFCANLDTSAARPCPAQIFAAYGVARGIHWDGVAH